MDGPLSSSDDVCVGPAQTEVTVEMAGSEMKTIAARLEQTYPESNAGNTAVVTPLLENLVGKYRTNLALLLGAVGLVLLIACANLANLFAARGAARQREFAIRAAVGASRTDSQATFDREFRHRGCRRHDRPLYSPLGARSIVSSRPSKRFPLSRDLV